MISSQEISMSISDWKLAKISARGPVSLETSVPLISGIKTEDDAMRGAVWY
jgi:hypothetical protein